MLSIMLYYIVLLWWIGYVREKKKEKIEAKTKSLWDALICISRIARVATYNRLSHTAEPLSQATKSKFHESKQHCFTRAVLIICSSQPFIFLVTLTTSFENMQSFFFFKEMFSWWKHEIPNCSNQIRVHLRKEVKSDMKYPWYQWREELDWLWGCGWILKRLATYLRGQESNEYLRVIWESWIVKFLQTGIYRDPKSTCRESDPN